MRLYVGSKVESQEVVANSVAYLLSERIALAEIDLEVIMGGTLRTVCLAQLRPYRLLLTH